MVLTEAPRGVPPDVEVRRAITPEDRLAAARIAAVAFGMPEPVAVQRETEEDDDNVVYLAFVDGEPVARGTASFSAPARPSSGRDSPGGARPRCVPRLVAARWDEAVRRGTPALVTQASPMSRPILAGLGFREVCEIRILLDDFDRPA